MKTDKVKCPACSIDIDGEYHNCAICNNTGELERAIVIQLQHDREFYTELLNQNKDNE